MTAKKATAIPNKVEATEGQMGFTKLGANLIIQLGTERWSRKVTIEESDIIKKKVLLYNKKPNDNLKLQIVKLMTPETVKKQQEKEKKEAQAKGVKQQVKKAEKTVAKKRKKRKIFFPLLKSS
jgi:hypothetical protein